MYQDLNKMVMAPALPNLHGIAQSDNNNPPPGKSKVDVGYSDSDEAGVWNFLRGAKSPQELLTLYRSYRDSTHCNIPKDRLREMRDTVARDMTL